MKRQNAFAFALWVVAGTIPNKTLAQPTVTNLQAFHRSGQTFLTWTEDASASGEEYYVYRHTAAITSANLNDASRVAILPKGSSIYWTERQRAGEYPPEANGGYVSLQNYAIQPLGAQLADTTGLFVWTTSENQNSYYAVTAALGGVENTSDIGAGNTHGPVVEFVADPEPVLVWQSSEGLGRVYTQYMDYGNWNPTYETPDGPTYAYNYFVGLPTPDLCGGVVPASVALILHIEGYGSRYEVAEGSHYYCAVELWGDDPRQSWYYGYSATHDYSQTETPVTAGPIVNFTEERLLRAVYDTLRDPDYAHIDPQRIYSYGHSMGGSGALALGLRYPNVFAAAYCSEPMTNYQTSAVFLDDVVPKWGSVAANLPILNRGVYASHLAPHNGLGVYTWQNHQAQLVQRRADETAHISLAHGMQDDVIEWVSQGGPAYGPFFLSRRPFSGEVVNMDHTWLGWSGLGPTVGESWDTIGGPFAGFQVRRDETLPGLAYATGSLGVPPTTTGGYNMNLEWSASWNAWDGAPVDTINEWGMSFRTTDGSNQTVDVTPRRLQNFIVTPGAAYECENRQVSDNSLVTGGTVVADTDGLVTVVGFSVNPDGNRLIVRPSVAVDTPTPSPTGVSPTATSTALLTFTPTLTVEASPTATTTPTYTPTITGTRPVVDLDLDLDDDGDVDTVDLLILLGYFRDDDSRGDVNNDGSMNDLDLFPYSKDWHWGLPIPENTPTRTSTHLSRTTTLTLTPTEAPTLLTTATPTTGGSTTTLHVPLQITFPSGWTGPAPMTVGVPLPMDVTATENLTVAGGSGPIPSQVNVSVRDRDSGRPRWLLVDFQAIPGEDYTLQEGSTPSTAAPISPIPRGDGGMDVDTGAGQFEIVPSAAILGAVRNAGGSLLATGGSWGGTPQAASIEVVYEGPLHAMVQLRSESAVSGLDLCARLHFFAGQPYLRVRLTLVNHTPPIYGSEAPPGAQNGECEIQQNQPPHQALASPGSIAFDDITWGLQLVRSPTQETVLYQDSSGTDNWNFYLGQSPRMQSGVSRRGFVRTLNGPAAETGDIALGTLAAGGVRFDVPCFRELFPKALRARSGEIQFGLFPGEFAINHQLRVGEQKTHDLWITLDPETVPPIGLRAHPSFEWLRSTHALGYVGPRLSGQFEAYEDYLDNQFDETGPHQDGLALSVKDAQERWDLFGWTDYGDLPTDFEDGRSPFNLKYDVGLGFIHQALRIDTDDWWRWAEIANLHFADVDILHTRKRGYTVDREWVEGGAWGHSLHDESGLANPHRNCNNPHPDLYYGFTGMAAWSLLTGDDMVRAAAIEMADNTLWRLRNTRDSTYSTQAWGGGSGNGYGVGDPPLRSVANSVRILVWAWRLTGDRAYLDGAAGAASWYVCERSNLTCGSWPHALFTRALGEYILATRDAGIPESSDAVPAMNHALQAMADHTTIEGNRAWFQGCTGEPSGEINSWMLLGADAYALGYAVTGERQWLDSYALPCFNTGSQDPFYPGDISEYHSSKELVNAVAAGTIFLHFYQEAR